MTLAPSDMLCFALYSAGHAMQSAYAPLLEPLGLTYPQYLVLQALGEKDDQTVGQLGQGLHLESNTLTPLLKRMEVAGWLSRQRNAQDQRQVRVRLSPSGRALVDKIAEVPRGFAERTGLTMTQLGSLRETLNALRECLRPRTDKRGPDASGV